MFKQFLDNVVPKDIRHELEGIWLDLCKYLILFIAVRSLELLLYETRAVLIATEFNYMVVNVLRQSAEEVHTRIQL